MFGLLCFSLCFCVFERFFSVCGFLWGVFEGVFGFMYVFLDARLLLNDLGFIMDSFKYLFCIIAQKTGNIQNRCQKRSLENGRRRHIMVNVRNRAGYVNDPRAGILLRRLS